MTEVYKIGKNPNIVKQTIKILRRSLEEILLKVGKEIPITIPRSLIAVASQKDG